MISIIDYGVGNLFSLKSSFGYIGENVEVTDDPQKIADASHIVLPGVGAFSDAVLKLKNSGLYDAVISAAKSGKPLLGICLGMQMLFEKSFEYGENDGLGLLSGEVIPMKGSIPDDLKIPHIGWNRLVFSEKGKNHPLFKYINEGDCVYFVHSFYADRCDDSLIASAEYGKMLTAAVARDNVIGTQFHPEKSGSVGLNILKSFCEM